MSDLKPWRGMIRLPGVATHYRVPGQADQYACGIIAPGYATGSPHRVDCLSCRRTNVWKRSKKKRCADGKVCTRRCRDNCWRVWGDGQEMVDGENG